jgi:hypothetical protein
VACLPHRAVLTLHLCVCVRCPAAVVSYVSLHDSTVMRKFDWHTESYVASFQLYSWLCLTVRLVVCARVCLCVSISITGISMNPVNDTFITTSSDGAFALWDLRNEVRPVVSRRCCGCATACVATAV